MARKEIDDDAVVFFCSVLSISSTLFCTLFLMAEKEIDNIFSQKEIDNTDVRFLKVFDDERFLEVQANDYFLKWILSIFLCLKMDDAGIYLILVAFNFSILLLILLCLGDSRYKKKQLLTAEGIFRSVRRGNIREIEYILSKNGTAVESKDKVDGNTPLHLATEKGNLLIVKKLLDHGADWESKNKHGETPLDRASRFHKTAAVEHLLERYAEKIMGQGGRLRSTSLHQILQDATYHPRNSPYRLTEKMQLPVGLLSFDQFCSLLHYLPAGSIRSRKDDGSLPLHVACRKETPIGYIRFLARKHSAALQTPDSTGALPLHIACQTATPLSLGPIRFLAEQEPAALHTPNNVGALPFHLLCGTSDPPEDVLKYLMRTDPEFLRAFILELLTACPDALPH